jgi:hypothetical protein
MRIAIIFCAMMTGCAKAPPVIEYRDVTPTLPPALFVQQPRPAVPTCQTEQCFDDFVIDLNAWGVEGWAHLAAVQSALAAPKAGSK